MDWIFGTYHRPVGEERWALGLTEPFPRGYLGQLVSPLRAFLIPVRKPQPGPQPSRDAGPQAADRA